MNQGPPDPHAPDSQPTRQGRRLIRMLFRSAAGDSNTEEEDIRAEDAVKNSMIQQENGKPPPVPSKFASLKRKLFPSQNRRHPLHVPPLISPISAPMKIILPPLGKSTNSLSRNSSSRDYDCDPIQDNDCAAESISTKRFQLKQDEPDNPESDSQLEVDNNWRISGRRTLMDDDDDLDLENAVEALDLESSGEAKTLEEMSKAINDLRVWKETHEHETQEALRKLKTEQERQRLGTEASQDPTSSDDIQEMQLELKRQQQQRERETQTLKLQKEADTYQLECIMFRTSLNESEATQVEQALQNSSDSDGRTLTRLRSELFELDVKQRQETLLQELQGDDYDFDINIVDVQAFTGELDAILAQFELQSS